MWKGVSTLVFTNQTESGLSFKTCTKPSTRTIQPFYWHPYQTPNVERKLHDWLTELPTYSTGSLKESNGKTSWEVLPSSKTGGKRSGHTFIFPSSPQLSVRNFYLSPISQDNSSIIRPSILDFRLLGTTDRIPCHRASWRWNKCGFFQHLP